MAVNDAGIWSPDDTEVFSPPAVGLHSWMKRQADSIARPEGTVTSPWRVHYKTTSQTVPNNVFTDVSPNGWTAGAGDPGGGASGISHSNDGYTINVAGWYRIEFDYASNGNGTGIRYAQIRIDGSIERTVVGAPGSDVTSSSAVSVVVERPLQVGDIVSFWARQTSGGGLGMPTGSDASRKFIRRIALT